jgi:hypothetical protein
MVVGWARFRGRAVASLPQSKMSGGRIESALFEGTSCQRVSRSPGLHLDFTYSLVDLLAWACDMEARDEPPGSRIDRPSQSGESHGH